MRPGPLPLGARVRSDSGGCFPWQPSLSIKSRDRGLSYRGWGKKVRALSFSGPQPRPMTAFKGVDSVLEKTGAPWVTRTPGLQIRSLPLYPTELRAHAGKSSIYVAGGKGRKVMGASGGKVP